MGGQTEAIPRANVENKIKAIQKIKNIRDELLKKTHSDKNLYADGVLDFYNEVVKIIIRKPE